MKKLEELSLVECKGEVYDRLGMIEQIQREVNAINQRIAELSQKPVAPKEPIEAPEVK